MPFSFGQVNEFSDSVTAADPIIEAVAKAIELGPFVGRFYESMGAPAVPLKQKTFEVYTRSKTSRGGTLGANWDDDDTADLAIDSTSIKGLSVGHVLQIGDEIVIVSDVDLTNNYIDVLSRGYGGTTAAAHTSGDAYEVIGFAGNDTDLKRVTASHESTSKWTNFVQTVFEVIEWTKHAELVQQGLSPANATQVLITEAEIRVAEMLSKMAVRGVKAQATNASTRFMSAGLIAQLGDTTNRGANVFNVNGMLTEAKFQAALKQLFDGGGNANTIWCSPGSKPYLNAFLGANSSVYMTSSKDTHTAGGIYVDSYNYEGKILNIAVDRDIPDSKIAVVNSAKCKKGWLENDTLRLVDEPQASSREFRKSLQGSIGFLIEDVGTDHILLYGITGGSTQRVHTVGGGIDFSTPPIATYSQITVNADSQVPAAAAANIGLRVLIGTSWTSGTKIATAVKDEIWASNGSAWVKQS